jgi:hypothetical protein
VARATRRRPGSQTLSSGTIQVFLDAVLKLMKTCVSVQAKLSSSNYAELPMNDICKWSHVPTRVNARDCGARLAGIDNSGPPFGLCRDRLDHWIAVVAAAARDEQERHLRRLLIFSFLVLYGPRGDAFRRARTDDFFRSHSFYDGISRPALRLYPGKTVRDDDALFLPLPKELAEWLDYWVGIVKRRYGGRDAPLFPSPRLSPGGQPRPISYVSFYKLVAGERKGKSSIPALLPRGANRYSGWHPHAYRHTAYQAAVRAGITCRERDKGFEHVHPEEFARALVGHTFLARTSVTYRDLNAELLACAVVEVGWSALRLTHVNLPIGVATTNQLMEALLMARKTIRLSDISGAEIPEGNGAVVRITFNDSQKGVRELDLTDEEAENLGGRVVRRRSGKPKIAAA